jgi:hypothetical protein
MTKSPLIALGLCVLTLSGLPAEEASKPSPQAAWADLAGADATRSARAVLGLTLTPNESVAFLKKHLQPVPQPSKEVAGWIDDLESNRFAARRKAMAELEALGKRAEPYLQAALAAKPSLDVSRRLDKLLDRLKPIPEPAEWVRSWLAILVLEHIGTAEARQVLKTVAGGCPGARTTVEAREALERLAGPRPLTLQPSLDNLMNGDAVAAARTSLALLRKPSKADQELRQIVLLLGQVPHAKVLFPVARAGQAPAIFPSPYLSAVLPHCQDAFREEKRPVRAAVGMAIAALQRNHKQLCSLDCLPTLPTARLVDLRRKIEDSYKDMLGEEIYLLGKAAEELEEVSADLAGETRDWQLSYEHVLARLYARRAFTLECAVMLAKVRRNDLPALDPAEHAGWRLGSTADLHDHDGRHAARHARKLMQVLAAKTTGTLWEAISKDDAEMALGLEWVPFDK